MPEKINQILDNKEIKDFKLSDLKPTKNFGGSSRIYNLEEGEKRYVVKEQLSDIAREVIEPGADLSKSTVKQAIDNAEKASQAEKIEAIHLQLENRCETLKNNLKICREYLNEYVLNGSYQVKENKNGIPTIYFKQEHFPQDCITLDPANFNFVFDDVIRDKLKGLIIRIKKMYEETSMMVDLLTLNNVAFSPSHKTFYLFDVDPLICSSEKEKELVQKYMVSSRITNSFKSYLDNPTQNGLEANFEHLKILEELCITQ